MDSNLFLRNVVSTFLSYKCTIKIVSHIFQGENASKDLIKYYYTENFVTFDEIWST